MSHRTPLQELLIEYTRNPGVGSWMQLNGDTASRFQRALTAWSEQVSRAGADWADFARMRYEQDVRLCETLLGCRDPKTASSAQVEFAQKALRDYTEQLTRLAEESLEAATAFWTPFAEPHERPDERMRSGGDVDVSTTSQRHAA